MMKSEVLTAGEIQTALSIRPSDALQAATLGARIRSGLRFGVAVEAGAYSVHLTAYAIGKNGKPLARVGNRRALVEGLTREGAAAYLNGVEDRF